PVVLRGGYLTDMHSFQFRLRQAARRDGLVGRYPRILLSGHGPLDLLRRFDSLSGRRQPLRIQLSGKGEELAALAADSVDLAVVEAPDIDAIGQLVRVARKGLLIRR